MLFRSRTVTAARTSTFCSRSRTARRTVKTVPESSEISGIWRSSEKVIRMLWRSSRRSMRASVRERCGLRVPPRRRPCRRSSRRADGRSSTSRAPSRLRARSAEAHLEGARARQEDPRNRNCFSIFYRYRYCSQERCLHSLLC